MYFFQKNDCFFYIKDALQNIAENKKQIFTFVIFLTLSFIGITIT
ncbi:TPA: permease, partial [Escherichia coli]